MHEHIVISMELSPFANIIDIFIIKIRFLKKISAVRAILLLWDPKTACYEVMGYYICPILAECA